MNPSHSLRLNKETSIVAHNAIPTLRRLRKYCHKLEANLGYRMSFRPAWATKWDLVSKETRQEQGDIIFSKCGPLALAPLGPVNQLNPGCQCSLTRSCLLPN